MEGVNHTTAETPKMKIWPEWGIRPGESTTDWLLRRLLQDLQTLASDADDLILAYPPMVVAADQLAEDFYDDLESGERFVKAGLITQEMLDRAKAVDELISVMSDRHDPSLWTNEALRTREEWKEVRRLAKVALAAMGCELEPPPPGRWTVVPARK